MSKHSILSPSSAGRWLKCTPSARLVDTLKATSSVYADEGTLAHLYAALEIQHRLIPSDRGILADAEEYRVGMESIRMSKYHSAEMDRCVKEYVDFVEETYISYGPEAQIFIEVRLNLGTWVPEAEGTADVVIVAPGYIHMIDLKYGKGVPVSAINNPQLRIYALGCEHHFGLTYDFVNVRTTIHQPRLDSVSTDEMTLEELFHWAKYTLEPKANQAFKGEGEFVAGDHCRFCRAAPTCRALAEENLKIARMEFKLPDLLTPDEVADVLSVASRIQNWLNQVKEHALLEALKGHPWPGFKLVQGKSNRVWTNRDEVVKRLIKMGQPEEHIYAPRSVLSPAQIEKALGKKDAIKMKDLIFKPTGKPSLVPVSDKREAYDPNGEDLKAFAQFALDDEENED